MKYEKELYQHILTVLFKPTHIVAYDRFLSPLIMNPLFFENLQPPHLGVEGSKYE